MTMRVPKTLSEEKLTQIRRLVRNGLSLEEISVAAKTPILDFQYEAEQFAEELKHEKEQAEIDKHKYLMYSHDLERLLKYLNADMTIEELANITNKHETTIANQLRDWRNALAHKQEEAVLKGLKPQQVKRIMKLGSDAVWKDVTQKSLESKRVKIKSIRKNIQNIQAAKYYLEEWWNFGQIESIRSHPESISFRSSDANTIKLIKKYTPNWKDILMKAKGLKGRFVAVRVIQNFENTEPRLVDITASEGIMSMAKTYPMDTRKQSFTGRYTWEYFGHYEAKAFNDTMYIVNADGWIASYPMGNPDDALAVKVINTIDLTEGEPLLICVDRKNPVDKQGITIIADVHAEKDGYEVYAEDHITILEQIAMTKDAAEAKRKELDAQKKEIELQRHSIMQKLDQQRKTTEQAELQMNAEIERELRDFERQEHFLGETKEALHEYKVRVMAAERDKQGDKPVAFQMDGLSVLPRQFKSRDLTAALRKLHETMQNRKRREGLLAKPVEQAAPPIKQSDDITTSDFIFDQAIAEQEAQEAAAMFDDSAQEQMPEWARQLFEKVDKVVQLHQMSETDKNQLNEYIKEEEAEEAQDRDEFNQEVVDILNRKDELFAEPFKVKVYAGHARNSIATRFGVDLTTRKDKDRLLIEVTSHIRSNKFLCKLPEYNNIECSLALVVDSNDKKDVTLKSALYYHNSKPLQKAQNKVIPTGGKRLVGSSMAKYLAWHKEIYEQAGITPPLEVVPFEDL